MLEVSVSEAKQAVLDQHWGYYDFLFVVHLYGVDVAGGYQNYLAEIASKVIHEVKVREGQRVVVLLCGGATDPKRPELTEADQAKQYLIERGVPTEIIFTLETMSGAEHVRAATSLIRDAQNHYPGCGFRMTQAWFYYDHNRWSIRACYEHMLCAEINPGQAIFRPLPIGPEPELKKKVELTITNWLTWLDLYLPGLDIDKRRQIFIQRCRTHYARLPIVGSFFAALAK